MTPNQQTPSARLSYVHQPEKNVGVTSFTKPAPATQIFAAQSLPGFIKQGRVFGFLNPRLV
jgi:hypothetical protein